MARCQATRILHYHLLDIVAAVHPLGRRAEIVLTRRVKTSTGPHLHAIGIVAIAVVGDEQREDQGPMQHAIGIDHGQVKVVDKLSRRSVGIGRPGDVVPCQCHADLGLSRNNREDELIGYVGGAQFILNEMAFLDKLDSCLGIHKAVAGGPVRASAVGHLCPRIGVDVGVGACQISCSLDQDGLQGRR